MTPQTHDVLVAPEAPKDHLLKKYINSCVGRYANRVPTGSRQVERNGVKGEINPVGNRNNKSNHRRSKVNCDILQKTNGSLCTAVMSDSTLCLGSFSLLPPLPLCSLLPNYPTFPLYRHPLPRMRYSDSYLQMEIKGTQANSQWKSWSRS